MQLMIHQWEPTEHCMPNLMAFGNLLMSAALHAVPLVPYSSTACTQQRSRTNPIRPSGTLCRCEIVLSCRFA
jgi:hypothetical protein